MNEPWFENVLQIHFLNPARVLDYIEGKLVGRQYYENVTTPREKGEDKGRSTKDVLLLRTSPFIFSLP
jgi:hypothetical protein